MLKRTEVIIWDASEVVLQIWDMIGMSLIHSLVVAKTLMSSGQNKDRLKKNKKTASTVYFICTSKRLIWRNNYVYF